MHKHTGEITIVGKVQLVLVSCLAMRKASILLCISKTKLYLES